MLSAIIATHESERTLVRTLAALVPGAATGLLAEVIVADAGSCDATAEVADIADCRALLRRHWRASGWRTGGNSPAPPPGAATYSRASGRRAAILDSVNQ